MFHSDLLAVNAPVYRLGALFRNLLAKCARGCVAKVSAEAHLARAEQVTNGFDHLVVVVRLVANRLNDFE
jgi:hypothetical protein